MPHADFQPSTEGRLIRARRHSEDARDQLRQIGHSEREQTRIDTLIADLKRVEARLSDIWLTHYGADSVR
jgi:phage host-nuclease inhibitor protein Gam